MAVRRYAVIDAFGTMINAVNVNDPMPGDYWPGYGKYFLNQSPGNPTVTRSGLPMLPITPDKRMEIGDRVNFSTGVVTKFAPRRLQTADGDVTEAPTVRLRDDRLVADSEDPIRTR